MSEITKMNQGKHIELKDKFTAMLGETRGNVTPEEMAMLGEFLSTEQHLTVEEFLGLVSDKLPGVDRRGAQRFLSMLVDYGIARQQLINGKKHFEHFHINDHHDHLVCVKCGAIDEFRDEAIELRQVKKASERGFIPLMHRLEIHGLCLQCIEALPQSFRLVHAFEGDVVLVIDVHGSIATRQHMASLGIFKGAELVVSHSHGKMLVLIRGSRMVLDWEMAGRIEVTRAGFGRERCVSPCRKGGYGKGKGRR